MKSDSELKRDVESELRWEPSVDEAHVGVAVTDGIVTLSGHVPSYAEKYGAEKAAKRVYGVRAVADELDVKLPGSLKKTDEDIARACVTALADNHSVPADAIRIVVNHGRVTLEGEVDWQYERQAAANAVRNLSGVTALSNEITIRARVLEADVHDKIHEALRRSAELDARRIRVEVQDGRRRVEEQQHEETRT